MFVSYSSNAGCYTVDQQVQITCAATDATSGVASSTCQNTSGPAYSFGPGKHSYSATDTDKAGNVGSQSTNFTVTVTVSALQSLINRFCTDPRQWLGLPRAAGPGNVDPLRSSSRGCFSPNVADSRTAFTVVDRTRHHGSARHTSRCRQDLSDRHYGSRALAARPGLLLMDEPFGRWTR